MTSLIVFDGSDQAYQSWLRNNPDGYVHNRIKQDGRADGEFFRVCGLCHQAG